VNGKIIPKEQDHSTATTVKLLSREDGKLDWNHPAEELERIVRAYDPWPGTFTMLNGKRLKILKAEIGAVTELGPGTAFIHNAYPAITCGKYTSLTLLRVQPEGKSAMDGKDFLKGHKAWESAQLT
jgi:methionyl-tRNA formyltransferase